MYYPIQMPRVLNTEYQKHIQYQEYQIPSLQPYIMCVWKTTSKHTVESPITNVILPDGCIDMVIDMSTKRIVFSGFSKDTEEMELVGEVDFIGVRFRPGGFHYVLGIPSEQAIDRAILYEDIDTSLQMYQIFSISDTTEQLQVIESYLTALLDTNKDPYFLTLVDRLYALPTNHQVENIAQELGYSSRQLHRLFKKHYGVTPKVLFNIFRLHKCLALLLKKDTAIVQVTLECGYYDQSHFFKDMKRYIGVTPVMLLEQYQQELLEKQSI